MLLKNRKIITSIFILTFLFAICELPAQLTPPGGMQQPAAPKQYTILGISVEGNIIVSAETIIALSGLRVGEQIALEGETKIQKAVRSLWTRKQFSAVDIRIERVRDGGVFLLIDVREFPRLSEIIINDNEEIDDFEIRKAIGKSRGDLVSNYDLYKTEQAIKALYNEEGLAFAKIGAYLEDTDSSLYKRMIVDIDEGLEFWVKEIRFEGNEVFSEGDLAGAFDETDTKSWWQIWKSDKFEKNKYEEDLELLKKFFEKEGYIDAEILSDTVMYYEDDESVVINIKVSEGNRVFVRNIDFQGNTVYPDGPLLARLEFDKGDAYDVEKFNQNLSGNENQTDASSLYLDNGYLQARLIPEVKRVAPDSVDVIVSVFENDRFRINKVKIVGNTKTKDKVIRRELYTRPGDYFDRSAIIRSIRALQVMQYFNPETLLPDVQPSTTDNTAVDVIYKVEERSTDTFNASVGFAGSFGLTGAIGFTFNNFSITEPLKGGGGQIFNFNWEFGQINRYRTFTLGLTEPWLFDEPTTLGFNLFDTYYNFLDLEQQRTGIGVNIGRRFRWPDDYWRGDLSFRFQLNDNAQQSLYYREGKYTEFTTGVKLSRLSLNNIFFPTFGSRFSISSNFAMQAIGLGETDYIKNELNFDMYNTLAKIGGQDRVVGMLGIKTGYIAGFNSDTAISPIELYRMGGNGLSGFSVTPLRGYPDNKIGGGQGSRVLSKYTAELRFAISLDPMPIYVYGFAEAGNVWADLQTTDPFDLKRAAGVGIQLMVQPIGVIGFSYGYGFDPFDSSGEPSGWRFLFHLGQ